MEPPVDPFPEGPSARRSARWPLWVTYARWITVFIVTVLMAAVATLSFFRDDWRVCRQELASGDAPTAVEVCEPARLEDLSAPLLLVVVLLLPDMSEVTFGVFSLKRRVVEAERKQEALAAQLHQFQTQLVSQTASQSTMVNVFPPDPTIVSSRLDAKVGEFLRSGEEHR